MIRRIKILWILSFLGITFVPLHLTAQGVIGARGVALGNATTALYDYDWGLFSNPATITSETERIGFYGLRYYGFPELTDISSTAVIPISLGAASFGFYRYGDDLYSETNINAGLKSNWEFVHAGISIQYRHLSLGRDYGSGGAVSISLGLLSQLSESLWIGAKVQNMNRASYNFEYNDEELPQDLSVGILYQLEERARFVFDAIKDVRFPTSYRAGLEVEIVENLTGRVGSTVEPVTYTFGLGYQSKAWNINLAVQQHELLGTSPGADFILKL